MKRKTAEKPKKKSKSNVEKFKHAFDILDEHRKKVLPQLKKENLKLKEHLSSPDVKKVKRLVKKYKLDKLSLHDSKLAIRDSYLTIPIPISRKHYFKTLDVIDKEKKRIELENKPENKIIRVCRKRSTIKKVEFKESWDSPTYLIRCIRMAVLKHEWEQVTHLLLFLLDQNRAYLPFIKEMTFLNLLMNKADYASEILDDFQKLCFMKMNKTPGPLSVCLIESDNEDLNLDTD